MMVKESKQKILNTLDGLVAHMQGDVDQPDTEWQAVMIARECLASSSTLQLAKAIQKARTKLGNQISTKGNL
jgi:hypothetical protein